jgi:serine/threonine protein phosphatase PrpC
VTIGAVGKDTNPGRRRRRNEDAYVIQPPLFAVADGMGGAQAGEIASRLAADALREEGGNGDGEERVASLVREANRRVYERSRSDSAASGMGTTVTAALLEGDHVRIGHVGDSRAYLIRNGLLEQLTQDHSLVAELMRDGKLSQEEADAHPQRSVITRALGTDPEVDVDTFTIEARPGDVFLLCSDGLTTMVGDESILRMVEEHRGDLDRAARTLVSAANSAGGEDNITVVLFEIATKDDLEDTRRYELPPEPAADDEDTLSGIEAVPAVDTAVVPVEEIEEAVREHEEEESGRRRSSLAFRLLLTLAVLAVLAAVVLFLLLGLGL